MKAEEIEKEFQALPAEEQMNVLRKLLSAFCRTMKEDPKKAREMFSLFSEDRGGPMANMMSMMARKGVSCCG